MSIILAENSDDKVNVIETNDNKIIDVLRKALNEVKNTKHSDGNSTYQRILDLKAQCPQGVNFQDLVYEVGGMDLLFIYLISEPIVVKQVENDSEGDIVVIDNDVRQLSDSEIKALEKLGDKFYSYMSYLNGFLLADNNIDAKNVLAAVVLSMAIMSGVRNYYQNQDQDCLNKTSCKGLFDDLDEINSVLDDKDKSDEDKIAGLKDLTMRKYAIDIKVPSTKVNAIAAGSVVDSSRDFITTSI